MDGREGKSRAPTKPQAIELGLYVSVYLSNPMNATKQLIGSVKILNFSRTRFGPRQRLPILPYNWLHTTNLIKIWRFGSSLYVFVYENPTLQTSVALREDEIHLTIIYQRFLHFARWMSGGCMERSSGGGMRVGIGLGRWGSRGAIMQMRAFA